tara:strand:+ start:309 stop:518 length:210 start_codon:yes stop_codon:yes gene_type:complete
MKKTFSLFLCFLLFFSPLAIQAEDDKQISEVPSKDALNYLLSEDMYQDSLSWQGNKTSTKFNYDKPKKN